jgi:hypothetical protein
MLPDSLDRFLRGRVAERNFFADNPGPDANPAMWAKMAGAGDNDAIFVNQQQTIAILLMTASHWRCSEKMR